MMKRRLMICPAYAARLTFLLIQLASHSVLYPVTLTQFRLAMLDQVEPPFVEI
jgi:hypothetical protein